MSEKRELTVGDAETPALLAGHDTRRGQDAARAKRTTRIAPGKNKPSLMQRFLRRRAEFVDTLPHATFSRTPMGIRSVVKAGIGTPTVVFEAGLGNGKRTWGQVFGPISEMTRAIAYDRAGYGQSEPSNQPRDGLRIVMELRAMLQTEGIEPPYVLVGHSLGGTYMKLYAKTYPREVAGMVLVDARHAEFSQRCRQFGVPRIFYELPEPLLAMFSPTSRLELEAAPLTLKQARRAGPFPEVPLIVLTQGGASGKWSSGLAKVWEASQRNLAKMSKLGRIKVCDDAGHNVHLDRPEVVVQAVLNVIRASRYVALKKRKHLDLLRRDAMARLRDGSTSATVATDEKQDWSDTIQQ